MNLHISGISLIQHPGALQERYVHEWYERLVHPLLILVTPWLLLR